MILYVQKHPAPGVIAQRQYLPEGAPSPGPAWEPMTAADFAAWSAAQPKEVVPEVPVGWRVSKDTIIGRLTEAGAIGGVMAAIASQPAEQQFLWTHSAWFWSSNPTLRGMCQALGLDPEVILAPDPYL